MIGLKASEANIWRKMLFYFHPALLISIDIDIDMKCWCFSVIAKLIKAIPLLYFYLAFRAKYLYIFLSFIHPTDV